LTAAREAVLAVLESAGEPLSAAGVVGRLDGACDQATVYRSLGYLERTGRAESFIIRCSREGIERYFAADGSRHHHWLHCESCHRFVDLGECALDEIGPEMESRYGVRIARHSLYFTGRCSDCAQGPGPD
jgi:Fur family ferric uptake transcriptional regulator